MTKKIPVILHTDIGSDIDDSWALLMLLRQNWLDLKYVLCDTGDVRYRAELTAASIEAFGRNDIPVGMGVGSDAVTTCLPVLEGYDASAYKGGIIEDGIAKFIEVVRNSEETVTLLSIGPAPAIKAALEIAPEIASKVRFVGMFGSYKVGYRGNPEIAAEYNVVHDIAAAEFVLSAPWQEMVITPLDSCGLIKLDGEHYKRLENAENPAVKALLEHYRVWRKYSGQPEVVEESSVLFDTVAVHLVSSTEYLEMQEVRLAVDDKGYTVESADAPVMKVAVGWKDLDSYKDFLTDTLLA